MRLALGSGLGLVYLSQRLPSVRQYLYGHDDGRQSGAGSSVRRSSTPTRIPVADTIAFNIAGSGVHTITLASAARAPHLAGRQSTVTRSRALRPTRTPSVRA